MEKKPALGKGLSALIPDATRAADGPRPAFEVDIDLVVPNARQPRTHYDETKLDELARSIAANGVIQPIIVQRIAASQPGGTPRYQIIAGERRWRAAQRAGLHKVPVAVRILAPADQRQPLEMALVENLQREDLNPMEEAHAYQRLAGEFTLTQEEIAARVGKDRATVANVLRLLKLPEEVQGDVAAGTLSMGHARAILGLAADVDRRRIARDVIARGLSVRETEALVKRQADAADAPARPAKEKDVHTRAAEEQLRLALGTRVDIARRGKGGVVTIAFTTEEELQRIYEYLTERR